MPKKWLIATNGTKYASEAVKYAGELYSELKEGPEVHLLVVAIDDKGESEAKAILELAKYKFEEVAGSMVNLHAYMKVGEPGKVIVNEMNSREIDHLFIGGADFKWDINDKAPGGISNYIIEHSTGKITLIK